MMPIVRTFVVEDSPLIRESLAEALEEMSPVKVIGSAEDEPTAVDWLVHPQNECDLGIVDIFLKRGSGLGVVEAVVKSGKECRLVVLSNYVTADMRSKCLALGADEVFDKSRDIEALINYCDRLAARQ